MEIEVVKAKSLARLREGHAQPKAAELERLLVAVRISISSINIHREDRI
jgi:hypothetical protein